MNEDYIGILTEGRSIAAADQAFNASPKLSLDEMAKNAGVAVEEAQKNIKAQTEPDMGADMGVTGRPAYAEGDLGGAVKGAAMGAADLAQNVGNFGIEIADGLEDLAASYGLGTGDLITEADRIDWSSKLGSPDDSLTVRATRQITKYAIPVVATMGAGAGVVAGLGAGAAADLLLLDPKGERLSTMLRDEVPELKNYPLAYAAVDYLSNKPDDTALEGRFKNMVEGLGLGAPIAGVFAGISKALRARKGAGEAVEQAMKAGATKEQAMEVTAKKLATEAELAASEAKMAKAAPVEDVIPDTPLYNYEKMVASSRGPTVNMNNPEVMDAVSSYAQANKGKTPEDFYKKVTFEELDSEAKAIVNDPDRVIELLKRGPKDRPLSGFEAKAIQYTMGSVSDNVVMAAEKAAASTQPEDLLHFQNMMDSFKFVDMSRTGAGSASGLSLNAHKVVSDMTDIPLKEVHKQMAKEGRDKMVADAIKVSGGQENVQAMAKVIKAINELPDETLIGALTEAAPLKGNKYINFLESVAINSMLSSPKTVMRNFIGSSLSGVNEVMVDAGAVVVGGIRTTFTKADDALKFQDVTNLVRGMMAGLGEGLSAAGQALRTGKASGPANIIRGDMAVALNPMSKETMGQAETILGKVAEAAGLAVGLPSRINSTSDAFVGTVLYRGKVYQEASVEAGKLGLKGAEAAEFVQTRAKNVKVGQHEAAQEFAKELTFSKALEKNVNFLPPGVDKLPATMEKIINDTPLLKVVLPFHKTSVNIVEYGFKNSPLSILATPIRQEILRGGVAADRAIARIGVSSTLLGLSAWMAAEGIATGPEVNNWKMRQALEESGKGWRANSIKLGDTYVDIKAIDPMSSVLRLGSVLASVSTLVPKEEYGQLAAIAGGAVADYMTPEMMVDGYSRLFEAFNESLDYSSTGGKAGVIGAELASRFIPYAALQRDIKSAVDPLKRNTAVDRNKSGLDQFTDKLINRYKSISPLWSDDLPVQQNMFGERLTVPPGLGPDAISPFAISKAGGYDTTRILSKIAGFKETVASADDLPDLGGTMPAMSWNPQTGDKYVNAATKLKLTPYEYEKLVSRSAGKDPETGKTIHPSGKNLREAMEEVIAPLKGKEFEMNEIQYRELVGELNSVILDYRKFGNAQMAEDPEIMKRWKQAFEAAQQPKTVDVFK